MRERRGKGKGKQARSRTYGWTSKHKRKGNTMGNDKTTADPTKSAQVGEYTAITQGWTVKQYDAVVPARITERFTAWLLYVADKVAPSKPIELTLTKPNGQPYSDSTYHTQVNAVLHNVELLHKYPVLADYRVRYLAKKTTLYMTKDHRQGK